MSGSRARARRAVGFVAAAALTGLSASAGETVVVLGPLSLSAPTEHKPQSKLWRYAGRWWAVAPSAAVLPAGTWVWRLEPDDNWSPVLHLSPGTTTRADVKAMGGVVHVLLHDAASPELTSIEYEPAGATWQPWAARPTPTPVTLPLSETATLDVDSLGRMWLAADGYRQIDVRWSDPPYDSWSAPITLASNVNVDDICAVVALPNATVGVMWSNQETKRFGFRVHVDGADPASWSPDEVPASSSALAVGGGMADDHLNLAVRSDGALYAAVKTSYGHANLPEIALLVRRPGGAWDPLHTVDLFGTRPIVLLNEAADLLRVVYTASVGGGSIVYRDSSSEAIAFGLEQTLMTGQLNDVTSTKERWTEDVVLLASFGAAAAGRRIEHPIAPVSYCTAGVSGGGCRARLTAVGYASAGAASGFSVHAADVEGARSGLFYFGANGRQANPWGNGSSYQCVAPPVKRAGLLPGTGTAGGCDGSFAVDLNALWCPECPSPQKNPGAGSTVQVQLWYRDPWSTSNQTTGLSDALEAWVAP